VGFADIFAALGATSRSLSWWGDATCPECRTRPEGVYVGSAGAAWLQPCGHQVTVDWLRVALPGDSESHPQHQ
jgi:hypothetical protein